MLARCSAAVLPVVLLLCQYLSGAVQQPADPGNLPEATRAAWLITVRLPVTESVAQQVRQQLVRVIAEASPLVAAGKRPVLILEFDTVNSSTGQGSNLGSCLDLAMALTDSESGGLHTVAFIPGPRGVRSEQDAGGAASRLHGHAVLVALACNDLAMHEQAAIGKAGVDLRGDGELEKGIYRSLVARRIALPAPVAMAMIDDSQGLFKVETSEGINFAGSAELEALEAAGKAISTTTIVAPGQPAELTSESLAALQLLPLRVRSRQDLATRLEIAPESIEGTPATGGKWVAAQLPLGNFIDAEEADWSLRMLDNHLRSDPDTNLLVVRFNTSGGELGACMRLARAIADLDSSRVRKVAFIETAAAGNASVIAMVCDQIVMGDQGTLGGPDISEDAETAISDNRPLIKLLAQQQDREWSVMMGLIDPDLEVSRYRNRTTGEIRLLCEEERAELNDADRWVAMGKLDLRGPLRASEVIELGLARSSAADFAQFRKAWQLADEPVQLQPSPADRWIEGLARWLASPMVAIWLLTGAIFLLSTEMSTPGIGVPGFIGALLLVLFFWSQYLGGNAQWLEILLFLLGTLFVVIELFVLPGFGLFGIGGLLLMVMSIVLASQTFVFPRNSEEWGQLPVSLSMVLASFGGFFAAVYFFGRHASNVPFLRRLMLSPPGSDASISPLVREKQEATAHREHLMGRTGRATTPLIPAGKAQIGAELVDVITDGRMVERGTTVRVVQVMGNRVMVEPVS